MFANAKKYGDLVVWQEPHADIVKRQPKKCSRLERRCMRINPNNFIAFSACAVVLALVFGATPFAITLAIIHTSNNKSVPNLAGTWQFNRDESDDPQSKMREAISRSDGPSGRSSPGGRLPEGGGFPGAPPRGGGSEPENSPGAEEMETVRTKMEERMRAAEVLEIIQSDSELTVNETGDDRLVHTETFYTDGRKSEQGKLETNAKWRGKKFVVETKLERGGKMTRTYELQSGGRELYVILKVENERMPQPLSIRSVYDKIQ
jgi:hypothetical protein